MTRRPALVAVLALALVGPAACSRDKAPSGEGRLRPTGSVVVSRGGKATSGGGARDLKRGDVVQVQEGSTATIELRGGDALELRAGTTVVLEDGPELREGQLLVTSASPRTVRAPGGEVDGFGATRIDFELALRVASYDGGAVVRSGGRSLTVPALRQAVISAVGLVPAQPSPYASDAGHPWDERFLGEALRRDPELDAYSDGYTRSLDRGAGRTTGSLVRILPSLAGEPGLTQELVDRLGTPGEALVGASIALEGRRWQGFGERFRKAAEFRTEGASWALVALDQQASFDALVRRIEGAIDAGAPRTASTPRSSEQALSPEAPPATSRQRATPRSPTTSAPATSGPPPSPPPSTTPTTAPRPTPPPPSEPGPVPTPPPTPLDPVVAPVVDPVVQLIEDLLSGLVPG